MSDNPNVVIDASALLALLNNEPGAGDVVDLLAGDAMMSTVNYSEVLAKLAERGAAIEEAVSAVSDLAVRIVDFDVDLAERAAALRVVTKPRGLSLGDRACLALAARESAPALTCDREWVGLVAGIEINQIDNRAR